MTAATWSRQHRAGARVADRIIHIAGTFAGVAGSAVLVSIAALTASRPVFYASIVYSFCLITMLACSAAYHLVSNPFRRKSLRQLDHAAIFLMIAGTYLHPVHDMSAARSLGDWFDWRGLDGGRDGGGHEAELPTSSRAVFDRCLPGARLGDPGGDAPPSSLGRRSDRGFYRGRRRIVFHRNRFSRMADAALPERYMAQLRLCRGQLSLHSYSAWSGVGPIVSATSPPCETRSD
jgi:hypothetical protein